MTENHGFQSTRDMLTSENPPTAVMVSSMISALGARRAIEDLGLTMGRDVSIITHDDVLSYLQNGLDVPIFTATRSSVRDAGRKLAEILLCRIANPVETEIHELLEAELIIGQSTGPAPKRMNP
jgi:LacI family transcriptional regulator